MLKSPRMSGGISPAWLTVHPWMSFVDLFTFWSINEYGTLVGDSQLHIPWLAIIKACQGTSLSFGKKYKDGQILWEKYWKGRWIKFCLSKVENLVWGLQGWWKALQSLCGSLHLWEQHIPTVSTNQLHTNCLLHVANDHQHFWLPLHSGQKTASSALPGAFSSCHLHNLETMNTQLKQVCWFFFFWLF